MHKIPKVSTLLIACLLIVSCGGQKVVLPDPTPLEKINERLGFSLKWDSRAAGDTENNLSTLHPVFLGSRIYVASVSGSITAIEATNGNVVWQVDSQEEIAAGLGGDGQRIVVVTKSGNVVARSATDGAVLWQHPAGRVILGTPLIYQNGVYLRSIDGTMIGLDAATGEEIWESEFTQPNFTIHDAESITSWNDSVIVGTAAGLVVGFDWEFGITNWQIEVKRGAVGGALQLDSVNTFPLVAGNVLYIAAIPDHLRAYNLQGRSQLWTKSKKIGNRLAADSSQVYGVGDNDEVFALDRLDGSELWSLTAMRYRGIADIVPMGGYLIVADRQNVLHAVEVITGKILGRIKLRGTVAGGGLDVRDGVLYVSFRNGNLHAYSLGTIQ